MADNEFFPKIKQLAENTDAAPEAKAHDNPPYQEIESLCMHCNEQGVTRMMLTSIPGFGDVIVMSFRCESCGTANNEIQVAEKIKPKGVSYTVQVLLSADLNRQIVRSESCAIEIPEFELQLPPSRGQLTTVEGLLCGIVTDLEADQPLRRVTDETAHTKIQNIIDGIQEILGERIGDRGCEEIQTTATVTKDEPVKRVITLKVDDPSGRSFVEFLGGAADPKWAFRRYARNEEQNRALGLLPPQDSSTEQSGGLEEAEQDEGPDEEIYEFRGVCSSCARPLSTYMKQVSIPHFKDVLIMSTNCEHCGYRDNEVKSGSAISEKGKKITLKMEGPEDLSRDILKSETCGLKIPEIDLDLQCGTLGGRFTTVEGILGQIYEELSEVRAVGDSDTKSIEEQRTFEDFLKSLKECEKAEKPFTIILDDPLANSHLQNIYAPDPDPNMTIETYERTWEQNEALGLNDIRVEDYGDPAPAPSSGVPATPGDGVSPAHAPAPTDGAPPLPASAPNGGVSTDDLR